LCRFDWEHKTRPKRSYPFVFLASAPPPPPRQLPCGRADYQKPCRHGPLWNNQLLSWNNETCRLEQWRRHAAREKNGAMEGMPAWRGRGEGLGSGCGEEDGGGGRHNSGTAPQARERCRSDGDGMRTNTKQGSIASLQSSALRTGLHARSLGQRHFFLIRRPETWTVLVSWAVLSYVS
jgi:hypothetical protein